MSKQIGEVRDLDHWLRFISLIHPREIELGLDRIKAVAVRMGIAKPARKVVVIAGTNGKGSCVTSIESILVSSGYKVASYTSPHILRFTERIKLNGNEVDEMVLCSAFANIESCRAGISLSYFEYSTLAALWIFSNEALDVALLEVGLGGRLDAVNIVDGDVTLISSISLDHQDWLGESLDEIGLEKAGILRSNIPLVYGDEKPINSILDRARELNAPVYLSGHQFYWKTLAAKKIWNWMGLLNNRVIELNELPIPQLLISNVALALQAIFLLDLSIETERVKSALSILSCAGRQEYRLDIDTGIQLLLDVAHNPAATMVLADSLRQLMEENRDLGQISVVMAVMADKDIVGIATPLQTLVDIWYIAQVKEPRRMPSSEAVDRLEQGCRLKRVRKEDTVVKAYRNACRAGREFEAACPGKTAMVIVLGSFYTVGAVRKLSKSAG